MKAHATRLSLGLALLTLGCDAPGIMELEFELPPAPSQFVVSVGCSSDADCRDGNCVDGDCIYSGGWYSQIEVSQGFDFVDGLGDWVSWNLEPEATVSSVPLPSADGSETRFSCTSVVGDEGSETIRVRLRYCRDSECGETLGVDLEHYFEIEAPFYAGKRTYVRRTAPPVRQADVGCSNDSDCEGASHGPHCVSGNRCGCRGDDECGSGHCEGLSTGADSARCTTDVARCEVAGCIALDAPSRPSYLCVTSEGSERHPCEIYSNVEYERPLCWSSE